MAHSSHIDGRLASVSGNRQPAPLIARKASLCGADPFELAEELEPDSPVAAAELTDVIMAVAETASGNAGYDWAAAELRPLGVEMSVEIGRVASACERIRYGQIAIFDGASDLALALVYGPDKAQAASWAVHTLADMEVRDGPLIMSDTLAELLVAPIVRHCAKHNAISGQRDAVAMATAILADQWAMPPGMIERAVAAVEQRDAQMAACTF
jgi:hypothetical protein